MTLNPSFSETCQDSLEENDGQLHEAKLLLHSAIEVDQAIILEAELLLDELDSGGEAVSKIREGLESIIAQTAKNAQLIESTRARLRD
jgi:hypothetical protein